MEDLWTEGNPWWAVWRTAAEKARTGVRLPARGLTCSACSLPAGPLRLACLAAHCDDIEIGAGGTLLRLLDEHPGSTVDWLVLSSSPARADEERAGGRGVLRAARRGSTVRIEALPGERDAVAQRRGPGPRRGDGRSAATTTSCSPPAPTTTTRTTGCWPRSPTQKWRDHPIWGYEIAKWDGDLTTPNLYVRLDDATVTRKVDLLETHFPSQHDKQWYDGDAFTVTPAAPGHRVRQPLRRGLPRPQDRDLSRRRRRAQRRARGRGVDLVVHGLGDLVGQPGQRLQLLERGLLDLADPTELLHQPLLAGLAEAGDAVEHRGGHALAPQLAVVRDGEAVGLVADALEQVERLAVAGHRAGLALPRHVDLLEALGQRGDRDLLLEPELLEHLARPRSSWPLPPSTSSSCGG